MVQNIHKSKVTSMVTCMVTVKTVVTRSVKAQEVIKIQIGNPE